jgi:hypothetical protein
VIYLYLDRLNERISGRRPASLRAAKEATSAAHPRPAE